jgi:hypothetical protein
VPAPAPTRSRDGSAALLNFGLRLHDDQDALNREVGLVRTASLPRTHGSIHAPWD